MRGTYVAFGRFMRNGSAPTFRDQLGRTVVKNRRIRKRKSLHLRQEVAMASADDVVKYVLDFSGDMSAMKLQKLVYYSQAWHLVWEECPLFQERIEAWANGPVAPALYVRHRGQFMVKAWPTGDAALLTDEERSSIDAVLGSYGEKSGYWLSELTHMEDPWVNAREGLAPGERGETIITEAAMAEYYGGLGVNNPLI